MPDERILYILGAGFSAPLGLPLTGNFLSTAKDLYADDPERYASFGAIFALDRDVARIGRYFKADFFNIEEILSILEMRDELTQQLQREAFKEFICEVIRAKTPQMTLPGVEYVRSRAWHAHALGVGETADYGRFVANLFRLQVRRHQTETGPDYPGSVSVERMPTGSARYAILTLNYDTVLENVVDYLRANFSTDFGFTVARDDPDPTWERAPYLAKLHGSVDRDDIIPPTWSKALRDSVQGAWRLAHELVSEATKIRVIGYSLPSSDSNVRYLLKAGILASEDRLKQLDVICLDSDGGVAGRYSEMFSLRHLRFVSADTADYLVSQGMRPSPAGPDVATFSGLEQAHQWFMHSQSESRGAGTVM